MKCVSSPAAKASLGMTVERQHATNQSQVLQVTAQIPRTHLVGDESDHQHQNHGRSW